MPEPSELLVSVGQAGKKVSLVKKSIKSGLKSNIKPGNKREIVLHKPIAVDHPVVERKYSHRARTEGVALGYQKTTKVQAIRHIKEQDFLIETETSFYKAIFL